MMFKTQLTADGSETFYSPEFDEKFHSQYGAKTEAQITYIQGCRLAEKIRTQDQVKIIDVCYGLGYNTAEAIDCYYQQINPQCQLQIVALELDETVPRQAIERGLLENTFSTHTVELLTQLLTDKKVNDSSLKLELLIGDARQTIQQLIKNNFLADAIFLDPFSPPKCPQLWTIEFLQLLANALKPEGIIATYSCSASVRKALSLINLKIGHNYQVGQRTAGTIASYQFSPLPSLSAMEQEHLQTRASIPYRDPHLTDNAITIKQRRIEEQSQSILESTTKWKKRHYLR